MRTDFVQLNFGWNAEPNAPEPQIKVVGSDLLLSFSPNPWQFPEYEGVDTLTLRFKGCRKYRLGSTNDEGWYMGQCRFSRIAPAWGEFYEVKGDLKLDEVRDEWHKVQDAGSGGRHFLFYFRDSTFECEASDWVKENDT